MKPVAAIPLPPDDARITAIDFSADGESVLLGTNTLDGTKHVLGVMWIDWRTTPVASRSQPVPFTSMRPNLDAGVVPIDIDGDRVVAFVGSTAQFLSYEELWLTSRTARVGPTLLCQAEAAKLQLFLSDSRRDVLTWAWNRSTLELVGLDSGQRRVLGLTAGNGVQSIAINPEGSHAAFATLQRVSCHTCDGHEVATWPFAGKLHGLRFAEDDLGLWAIAREGVIQFPIGGAPVTWGVPGRRPIGRQGRTAFFAGPPGYCTLDLATGAVTELAPMDVPIDDVCWSGPHRRFATLALQGEPTLRVYQY